MRNGYLYLGYVHLTNYTAAQNALGQSGLGGVDDQTVANALVDSVNSRGGILGLKLKLVPFDRDATDQSTTQSQWEQQECAAWTQDTRVFATFTGEGRSHVLDQCLSRAGVIEVCGGCEISTYDDAEYAKYPLLYEPTGASVSRVVPFYIKGLVQSGFLKGPDVKIGLLAFENPTYHRAATQLAHELSRYGLSLTDQGFVQESQSPSDYGSALSQLQNYELKFSTDHINRVLVLDEGGAILGYGTTIADKQRYYPRWGVNSTSGPAALISSGAYDPESERTGQTVVGWVPGGDTGFEFPSTPRPPGLAACLNTLKAHQIVPNGDNATVSASQWCDSFSFLQHALQASGLVSLASFKTGAASLGTSFQSAVTFGTRWTSARRDGAAIYRTAVYNTSCGCFKATGPPGAM